MQENKTFTQKSCQVEAISKHMKHNWEDNIKRDLSKTACELAQKLYDY
jgi:hypothetical protein